MRQSITLTTLIIWGFLAIGFVWGIWTQEWLSAFVALLTFLTTLLPLYFAKWYDVHVPRSFMAAVIMFIFATLFLGEVLDFYNRYWWWDVVLHGGSAIGFGLIGFLLVFMMFQGDRYAAPPRAVGFFGFCFAMTIGALWEIFEYAMDQTFGMNMQKSGLHDTMWDLIVDAIGGLIGAGAGVLYLRRHEGGYFSRMLHEFQQRNRRFFIRFRDED